MGSLANLLDQLDPDPNIKGTQFERICKWFLENDPRYRHLSQVWLWDDWPGRWGIDAGIDLVAQDNEGHLWAIQAKAYKATYSVKKKDVDTFLTESNTPEFSYRLLIATTDRTGDTGERAINNQEKPVTFFGLRKLEAAQVDWPASPSELYPSALPPRRPEGDWAYQAEAMDAVVEGFNHSDRGQMIMACGTGKTLTALFIKEKLGADRTLVLTPSLSLLSQTLTEWTANATTAFEHLPVCSDETVADSIVMSANELGDRVTTDPEKIADFLRGSGPRTVFATYQSSPEIAKAFKLGKVDPFDLIVADEAHRTTGRTSTAFGTVLDDEKIKAKRRLFMTATPRYFTGRVIGEAAALDHDVVSMDNETKYGPVFHRLPFSEAIERGLLTDYQVVVIGVDDVEYRKMAEKATWVRSDGIMDSNGYILAAQIGLAKAMRRYDLRRAISFHSRVEGARRFSRSLTEVIPWMPARQRPTGQIWANYVSGEMSAKHRALRLSELGAIDTNHRGLLSNARCLTEGVDVPTLDGVVFVDPRHSEVDIVQAVGRAIRLAPDKTVGTIVIPVFMASGDDHEVILDDSAFKTVWWVVKALRLHDEELAEQLDSLRLGLGLRGAGQGRPEKIVLDLPAHIGADFVRAFNTRLVNSVTAPWMEMFGVLQRHFEDTGTTRFPQKRKTPDGYPLGTWEAKQRDLYRKGKLSAERVELLKNLGDWSWEPFDAVFEKFVEELHKHLETSTTTRVSQVYKTPDGYALGARVGNYRAFYRNGKLSAERAEILSKIGDWTWEPQLDKWEKTIEGLQNHYDEHGTTHITQGYKSPDGYPLGARVSQIRLLYNQGKLSTERIERVGKIGDWTWGPWRSDGFEEFIEELRKYHDEHRTTHVPQKHKTPDGYPLGARISDMRSRKRLSAKQISILNKIGDWTWDARDTKWEKKFEELRKGGTAYFPEGHPLAHWAGIQRAWYKNGKLSAERIKRLNSLDFWTWEPSDDRWEKMRNALQEYYEINGTTRVRRNTIVNGQSLDAWVYLQRRRYKQGKLSAERIEKLKKIGDWTWDARS